MGAPCLFKKVGGGLILFECNRLALLERERERERERETERERRLRMKGKLKSVQL